MKLSTLNSKLSLISVGTNAKTIKGDDKETLTAILYLAPSTSSTYDVCPSSSEACSNNCLGLFAGRSHMTSVQKARIRKTKLYFENQEAFIQLLYEDFKLFESYCIEHGIQDRYVRLNGSSDIEWEDTLYGDNLLFSLFPNLIFYDYTKIASRLSKKLPSNYHLTFSRDGDTPLETLQEAIDNNINVAVVFEELPETYLGRPVVDGDLTDIRVKDISTDGKGLVIGLKPKGKLKKSVRDNTDEGFVVRAVKPQLLETLQIE